MNELTPEQIARQDAVDNAIFEMIKKVHPVGVEILWDVELIGPIRDRVESLFVDDLQLVDRKSFYPYV